MGSILRRLDGFQRKHAWAGFPFAVLKKFGEDQAGNLAALVAYYAIFSIFPLLLALSSVLAIVLHGNPHLQHEVTDSALKNLPLVKIQTSSSHTGSIAALAVGLGISLWSGLGVAKSAQTAFNTVYLVSHVDRPNFLKSTLRALGLVTVGGLGLIVTTAISSAVTSVHTIGGVDVGIGLRIAGTALAVALNTLLFLVLFRWLTVRHVRWRDSLPGALLSAVSLQVLQMLAAAFISHKLKGASTTYGKDVAGVIVLLSWFYLQAQVVLIAVEVNVVRQYKLWPRALTDPPATEADFRTYEAYAERERYRPEEDVDTEFDGEQNPIDRPTDPDQVRGADTGAGAGAGTGLGSEGPARAAHQETPLEERRRMQGGDGKAQKREPPAAPSARAATTDVAVAEPETRYDVKTITTVDPYPYESSPDEPAPRGLVGKVKQALRR